jgi:hypothetical protein
MESELSITLIKLAEVTEQRDSLHELHNKNAARSKELLELCGTLRKELTKVTEQRDRLFEQQEQWRLSSVCRELVEQRDILAEALERILDYQGRFAEEEPESIAREALKSLAPNK